MRLMYPILATFLSLLLVSCIEFTGYGESSGSSTRVTVTTLPATNITDHGATLNGIINTNDLNVAAEFRWGSDPKLRSYMSTGVGHIDIVNEDVSVSAPISSLASSTTYYVQAYAFGGQGTITQFTTSYEYEPYWIRSYGGGEGEYVPAIINTTDGGYLIAGRTNTFAENSENGYPVPSNMWIVKLTAEGAISWQKSIGGAGIDQAGSVVQTIDGNYLIAGWTEINYAPGKVQREGHSWLVKLDQQGNTLWQMTYTEGSISSMIEASDGSLLLSGNHTNTLSGNHDYWLARLDSIGNILWQYAFDTSQDDLLVAAAPTANGVVLAGKSASYPWLLEVSLSGSIAWQGYYNCKFDPSSIATLANGGFVVAGLYSTVITSVMKIEADGTIGWLNSYGDGSTYPYIQSKPNSIIETSGGDIVTAGCIGTTTYSCRRTSAMKLASDGSVIWRKQYNLYIHSSSYFADGYANSIGEDSSGNLYLAASYERSYNDYDAQVIVLPADGTLAPIDSDVALPTQARTCSVASNPSVNIITTTAVANPAAIDSTQPSYAVVLQQAPQ